MQKFITLPGILVALSCLALSNPAWARRQDRTGFNFGTTVRVVDQDTNTSAGTGSDRNAKVQSSGQSVNPFVGYAFEYFNLGLSFSAESQTTKAVENNTDGQTTFERNTAVDTRGLSFFTRFLFGRYFFFEGAAGVYQERTHVMTETKHPSGDGTFVGEQSEYDVKGVGPGYQLGAGLELPMGGGFMFTSTYQTRVVGLRDYNGGSDLGKKRSRAQKRELLFGIAHYLQ